MPPAEVPARVLAIANFFLPLEDRDAAMILQLIASGKSLPYSWGDAPDRVKLVNVEKILTELPNDSLALLDQLIFNDKPTLENAVETIFPIWKKRMPIIP